MDYSNIPIQMLSICSAVGAIQPVRFRYETDEHHLETINITEVISTNEVQYVGVEAFVFLCKAILDNKERLFELRYGVRSHKWVLMRMIY